MFERSTRRYAKPDWGIETVLIGGERAPINIATALTFYKLAESMQGPAFFKHRAAGGRVRSNWLVFGIIIASAVTVLILAGVFLFATGRLDDVNG